MNAFFMKFLAEPLTVKSSGWKKCVILSGTRTISMFKDSRVLFTLGVICPLNTFEVFILWKTALANIKISDF